jgi:hypothetical protein
MDLNVENSVAYCEIARFNCSVVQQFRSRCCEHKNYCFKMEIFSCRHTCSRNQDSSVGIAPSYELDSPSYIPSMQDLHSAETGCGPHPASYLMDTGGDFPRG